MLKMIKAILFIVLLLGFSANAQTWDPFDDSGIHVAFQNDRLSIQAESANLRDVIARISKTLEINIIFPDEINKKITVHLTDLPWEKALETLIVSQQLDYLQLGEIWVISEKASQKGALVTLQSYPLNYAKASTISEMLNQSAGILSESGRAIFDERTNTLIIKDKPDVLISITQLLENLDVQVPQVQIEARILNANESFSRDLGLSFSGGNDNAQVSVNQPPNTPTFGDIQIGLAKLPNDIHLDLFISAAEQDNRTQVLATPKLLTANQEEAVIKQGKEIAFEETSASGATSIRFKEAVLELRVTPHITPNNEVILNLSVKHDVVGKLADNGQPTIDTKSITTQVQVENGETIVLGGIYSKTDVDQINRIPILGHIPIIGRLFRDDSKLNDKDELLIFVTPRIL